MSGDMLIKHYVKVAVRNLLKYRQQTFVSVVGLAIGFVCFALSVYWIRYERNYDYFQPDRDRIFRVEAIDSTRVSGITSSTTPLLAGYLKKNIPEVEATARFYSYSFWDQEQERYVQILSVDSGFFQVMRVETVFGRCQDLFMDKSGMIFSEKAALKNWGRTDVVGESFSFNGKVYQVKAVVKDWAVHTNFPFEYMLADWGISDRDGWNVQYCHTYIRIRNDADLKNAVKKIENLRISEWNDNKRLKLISLSDLHSSGLLVSLNVKYKHILIFSVIGGLVILCSMINFIVLYVSRLRLRGKELLLRKINGASNRGILSQLFVEILMILSGAFILGFIGLEWVLPRFKTLAMIETERLSILSEIAGYFFFIVLLLGGAMFLPVAYYRKRTYMQYVHSVTAPENMHLFRYTSLFFQLVIALVFMFCMVVFVKQIYHLTHGNIGFDRRNVCTLSLGVDGERGLSALSDISRLTSVEQVTFGSSLLPEKGWSRWSVKKDPNSEEWVHVNMKEVSPVYLDFMGMQVVSGSLLNESSGPDQWVLNETAAARLGLNFPEEYTVESGGGTQTIVGIVRDFYFESPLLPVCPVAFRLGQRGNVVFKYKEGQKKTAIEGITEIYKKRGIPEHQILFYDMEESYEAFFKSERAMLFLLSIVSGVCILISVFGVYAMVSLTSEQRRKEMAIRKVNGASVSAVLYLFLKEYAVITLISASVAFLISYRIMQTWLENYVNRTTIDSWIYWAVGMFVFSIVTSTVLIRVWQMAHIQPAVELKKE